MQHQYRPANPDLSDPRVDALRRLQILDTEYEPPFDRIVAMVARLFGVPNVGIHLLDDERQWAKAFEGQRFNCAREDSVCQFTLDHDDLLVITDLREDSRTCRLDIVTGPPYVRFYAGIPLYTRENHAVGTLCVIDTEPRPPLDDEEVYWLRQYADLVIETMELRVEYHRSQQELKTVTEFDAVTGLRNRATLIREGQHMLDAVAGHAGVAAIKIRLDRMDLVTGATGQKGAHAVLRTCAERLGDLVGPEDRLARGDGDTFLLLRIGALRESANELEAWLDDRAERIRERLAQPIEIAGERLNVTASLGLAAFTDRSPVYHVIDAAAAASLGSRDAGGDCAHRFTPAAFDNFRERVSIEVELREAVAERELVLNYQPIVDMTAGGSIVGAEALVRWPRGDRQPVGPDRFVPVAEEIGLIHELGLWVFEAACHDLAAWRQRDWRLWVSINLSPLQLTDPALSEKLVERAQAAGVDCSQIKLEITESALSTHADEVAQTLEALSEAGFLLALDDFGTGYSSLARLIHMPFDTLKVDRAFVDDCPDGPGAAVVTSVATLASELGMQLVAEGVEHEGHQRFLLDHNYQYAQGYFYARPMPANALTAHLANDC
jgi:EAL domain-containing protein (putative c-di-GMP-specific phosphodiesterase class I)/GGDEF domain-containing protein